MVDFDADDVLQGMLGLGGLGGKKTGGLTTFFLFALLYYHFGLL